ncbi:hypothetical protein CEUSTIGMA_g13396.t1 [Chlamydomonas eustigma]|uniref:Uncharacterized protein n=1 Tax=Chlamydomonas eustigma TaxID=1157962 RepID=A0A250XT55_9CHLO|nr:hypothetical protein CEUSTIGMA_g13396.t1 [Chlamydomonas eustigma]|eukprot:GAX85980.1 hypothetical protein CEUSTIGMA_g13396.t1 [Chlamydomonas eustigma]
MISLRKPRVHLRECSRITHGRPLVFRVGSTDQSSEVSSSGATNTSENAGPIVREYKAWGVKVVESTEPFPAGPEEEKDFWESDNYNELGKALENYFLPGLVVLGLVIGGYAANTYNEGATVFVKPASGPENPPVLIPAEALFAPSVAEN